MEGLKKTAEKRLTAVTHTSLMHVWIFIPRRPYSSTWEERLRLVTTASRSACVTIPDKLQSAL